MFQAFYILVFNSFFVCLSCSSLDNLIFRHFFWYLRQTIWLFVSRFFWQFRLDCSISLFFLIICLDCSVFDSLSRLFNVLIVCSEKKCQIYSTIYVFFLLVIDSWSLLRQNLQMLRITEIHTSLWLFVKSSRTNWLDHSINAKWRKSKK